MLSGRTNSLLYIILQTFPQPEVVSGRAEGGLSEVEDALSWASWATVCSLKPNRAHGDGSLSSTHRTKSKVGEITD